MNLTESQDFKAPQTVTLNKLYIGLGTAALAGLIGIQGAASWQWSLLMDDLRYLKWMPDVPDVWIAFRQEIVAYLREGRFYPVKYLANLLKWRYLPLRPDIFHAADLILLLLALGIGAFVILKRESRQMVSGPLFIFLVGFGFLQRPLLDIAALNSIGEAWVIIFLALGFHYSSKSTVLYKIFFLLAGLSKEPAVMAFAAASATHIWVGCQGTARSRWHFLQSGVDAILFGSLCLAMKHVQMQGPYLAGYSFLNVLTVKNVGIGMVKCLIGLLPVAAAWHAFPKIKSGDPRDRAFIADVLFLTLFACGYLVLVAARGVPGYLLIPPAFAFTLIGMRTLQRSFLASIWSGRRLAILSVLFVSVLILSLVRYERYISGINGSSLAFQHLLLTNRPRLILMNGEEASYQAIDVVRDLSAPVTILCLRDSHYAVGQIQTFKGDVALLEFSNYFEKIPVDMVDALGQAAGGWTSVETGRGYRLFYGRGHGTL